MRKLIGTAVAIALVAGLAPAATLAAPTKPGKPAVSVERCEDGMGYLRQVYATQVKAIDDDWTVTIWPICEGRHDLPLKSLGNATHLRGTVDRNHTLLGALDDADYRANDVIGIRFTRTEDVILYVHRYEY